MRTGGVGVPAQADVVAAIGAGNGSALEACDERRIRPGVAEFHAGAHEDLE